MTKSERAQAVLIGQIAELRARKAAGATHHTDDAGETAPIDDVLALMESVAARPPIIPDDAEPLNIRPRRRRRPGGPVDRSLYYGPRDAAILGGDPSL